MQLDNDARAMKELAADPRSTYTQLEMAEVGISNKYKDITDSKIVKQLNSIIEENLSEKNKNSKNNKLKNLTLLLQE